jgi:hypothetical protein
LPLAIVEWHASGSSLTETARRFSLAFHASAASVHSDACPIVSIPAFLGHGRSFRFMVSRDTETHPTDRVRIDAARLLVFGFV